MFLPIGDSPNLPRPAWVTWGLIAVNVAVYLACLPLAFIPANPNHPDYWRFLEAMGADRLHVPAVRAIDLLQFAYGAKPQDLSLVDALTSLFLHAGFLHLAGNMLFLFIFGDNVEHRLGRLRYLAAYLGTGLLAVLGDTLLRWGSLVPSIGASGAISGVLGLYFAWFPKNRVRVWAFLFPFYIGTLELPARFVLGMFLVLDNLLPLLLSGGGGGVSYGAHVGGFLAGWALAKAFDTWEVPRPRSPRVEESGPERIPLAEAFRSALKAGRVGDAASIFFGAPRRESARGLDVLDKTALGEALERLEEPRAALAAYQRALADHPGSSARAPAHLGAARVLMRQLGSPTSAYQHVYAALEEGCSPAEAVEARRLLAELRGETRVLPRRFTDGF